MRFLRGQRLDMLSLSRELGVNRATLYRWVGPREALLGQVCWSLSKDLHDHARAQATGRGAARLLAIYRGFLEDIVGAPALRTFFETDATTALRVLTRRDGYVQPGLVEATRQILQEEIDAGAFSTPVAVDTLAYAIVRVTEAFVFNDAIIALDPDVDAATEVVRLLLRAV